MKKALFLYVLFLLYSTLTIGRPKDANPVEIVAIEKAIVTNDIRLLGLLMDEWVTITIDNKANIYNKYQAQVIIKELLEFETGIKFTFQKVGKSVNNNSYFAIGTYTGKEKSYLIYFYLVYNKNRDYYLLKEIKFD